MKIPIYQVDAFAHQPFKGNPAAVCPLEDWLPDHELQAIAEENNLSETAFYTAKKGSYELRWFSPRKEVDLCGHATLAAAHIIFSDLEQEQGELTFSSKSGKLRVNRTGSLLTLDFPSQPGDPCEAPRALIGGLGLQPPHCFRAMDYMAVLETEEQVAQVAPDFRRLQELDLRGVIVTAPGESVDFVSRFFAPNFGIDEDAVTGSAHCTLAPYWARVLKKDTLHARQISKRTGELTCRVDGDRTFISGRATTYMEGILSL